ncbi:hypothetical protein D3C81_2270110 [compost metagenome]
MAQHFAGWWMGTDEAIVGNLGADIVPEELPDLLAEGLILGAEFEIHAAVSSSLATARRVRPGRR